MTDPAYERLEPARTDLPLLLLCDHASSALPASYGTLGLAPELFATHIASDIGAAEVTRVLAAAFGAPAVLGTWSRLLVDLNRGEDDPTLVVKLSDGSLIPGNARIDAAETARRIAAFHAPYHAAVAAEIAALRARGILPVLFSMHSFTPVWKGAQRPWEIGILWDRDARLARPLIAEFERAGFVVGDNEPYDGELEGDTLYRHGTMLGLPHVLIEMRQDLIADAAAARAFGAKLVPIFERALAAMGPATLHFTRPLAVVDRPSASVTRPLAVVERPSDSATRPLPITGSNSMDERQREQLEAAVFRRLVAHLRAHTDVQNIDVMTAAGFCRNCLGDWYREAAAENGIALEKDAARELVYGMPQSEWKKRYQKEATPEQQAAFAKKTHS